jgi:ketosteroid isomerase-like protein
MAEMTDDGRDERSIVAVLNRLAWILDERAWGDLDQVFTADAVAYGADEPGVPAIEETVRKFLGGCGPSQHLLGNHQIEVDGDTATARTKLRVMHQGADHRSDATYEVLGYYHDVLSRTAEGWRIAHREIDVRIQFGDFEVLQPG